MSEKPKERKLFVLREVELQSMTDIRKGDIFRLEPIDEADREFEVGNWWIAKKDGFISDTLEPTATCDPLPPLFQQALKGSKLT